MTGATGGVGAALVNILSETGYTIIAHYRKNHSRAQSIKAKIESGGGTCHIISSDLSSESGVSQLASEVEHFIQACPQRNLFGLVNNAALLLGPTFDSATFSEFDAYMAVNARAPYFLVQKLARLMQDKSGSIVNVSSAAAHFSSPGDAVYAMSKAAIESLTFNTAEVLAVRGIRINTIVPGFTDNGHPGFNDPEVQTYLSTFSVLGGVATASEVANAIAFLLSDKASRMTGAILDFTAGGTLGARPLKSHSLRAFISSGY